MAIPQTIVPSHWNYFLALESDLESLSRYIEFCPENYQVYSLELARLLLAAGAEIDVVMKVIVANGNGENARNIVDYRSIVRPLYPDISRYKIILSRFGLSFTPWERWEHGESPLWWRAYNDVKHERNENFASASLKNCLNAVAGLYVAVIHAYPDLARSGDLAPIPKLLGVDDEFHTGTSLGRHGLSFRYVV